MDITQRDAEIIKIELTQKEVITAIYEYARSRGVKAPAGTWKLGVEEFGFFPTTIGNISIVKTTK